MSESTTARLHSSRVHLAFGTDDDGLWQFDVETARIAGRPLMSTSPRSTASAQRRPIDLDANNARAVGLALLNAAAFADEHAPA